LFEKWQHAQRAALLPPYIAGFPCNPPRIPASNRLRLAAKLLDFGHISIFQTAPIQIRSFYKYSKANALRKSFF
jgi:hypothetical protein